MDWKDLAGPLVGAGAPVLGKILGGLLPIPGGSLVGEAAGNLLAKALGVAPTPEAVNDALHNDSSDLTLAKIKAAEAEAVAKWPALAEMAKAQHEAETAQFQAQLLDIQSARTRDIAVRATSNGSNPRAQLLIVLAFAYILGGLIFVWFNITELSRPGAVAVLTFLTTTMGIAMQWIGGVFAFEFGATRQGGDRSNQLADMAQQVITSNSAPGTALPTKK